MSVGSRLSPGVRRRIGAPVALWFPPDDELPAGWACYVPSVEAHGPWEPGAEVPRSRSQYRWTLSFGADGVVRTTMRRPAWYQLRNVKPSFRRAEAALVRARAAERFAGGRPITSIVVVVPEAGTPFAGPVVQRAEEGERGLDPELAFAYGEQDLVERNRLVDVADVWRALPLFSLLFVVGVALAILTPVSGLAVLLFAPPMYSISLVVVRLRRLRHRGVQRIYGEDDLVRLAAAGSSGTPRGASAPAERARVSGLGRR
jgi:hypothetical protein